MENGGIIYGQFGTFYGRLVHFMAVWYILWPFDIFYGRLVYFKVDLRPFGVFLSFWYIEPRKIWQP
jgi:hypothetical protein